MDADLLRDLFGDFGPIEVRRMFGGAGVFVEGLMIALVAGDVIYLKADAATISDFEAEGLGPFRYATRNGEHTLTSYWRMPERLYDEPEELARWARAAHAVALRAEAKSASKRSKAKVAKKRAGAKRLASPKPRSRPRGRSRS